MERGLTHCDRGDEADLDPEASDDARREERKKIVQQPSR